MHLTCINTHDYNEASRFVWFHPQFTIVNMWWKARPCALFSCSRLRGLGGVHHYLPLVSIWYTSILERLDVKAFQKALYFVDASISFLGSAFNIWHYFLLAWLADNFCWCFVLVCLCASVLICVISLGNQILPSLAIIWPYEWCYKSVKILNIATLEYHSYRIHSL